MSTLRFHFCFVNNLYSFALLHTHHFTVFEKTQKCLIHNLCAQNLSQMMVMMILARNSMKCDFKSYFHTLCRSSFFLSLFKKCIRNIHIFRNLFRQTRFVRLMLDLKMRHFQLLQCGNFFLLQMFNTVSKYEYPAVLSILNRRTRKHGK